MGRGPVALLARGKHGGAERSIGRSYRVGDRLGVGPSSILASVEHGTLSPLPGWESFYVIVGSSAAALTGLQFVVTVLSAEMRGRRSPDVTGAFSTPTIVHFCAVLLNAGILSAPWRRLTSAALTLAPFALAGIGYTLLVLRRARRQTDYVPVVEDWIWHTALPLLAYTGILVSAVLLPRAPGPCLFALGAMALLLLFVCIHNAWDSVVYIADRLSTQSDDKPPLHPTRGDVPDSPGQKAQS